MPILTLDDDESRAIMSALRQVAANKSTPEAHAHWLQDMATVIEGKLVRYPPEKAAERERLIAALNEQLPEYDLKDLDAIAHMHWSDLLNSMSDEELRAEYADRCGDDEDYGKPAPTPPTVIVDIDANGNPHHCQHQVVHTEGTRAVCSICKADLGERKDLDAMPPELVDAPAPAPAAPEVPETFQPFTLD